MKKKKKSVIPRKPDGKIDWKAYDKYLVQRSMKRFSIDYVTIGNESYMKVVAKRGGSIKGAAYVRRQKRLEKI